MKRKSRGFIAAPLIGTIIFLTAIVFIVNINKGETNNVAHLASNAYHNRITSIVELYRGDSGSMFREDLRKVIETALTSQCWSSFTVKSEATASMTLEDKKNALKTARFTTCDDTLETIQSIICSNSGHAITQECIDANTANGMTLLEANTACREEFNGDGQRAYGLQNWLENINTAFDFEGIELAPTSDSLNAFRENYQAEGEAGFQRYAGICRDLIHGVKMDCNAFANNYESPNDADKFKCCSVRTTQDQTCQEVGGVELPGCESGTFYVEVTPAAVFETLPRIQADAGQGNILVAGALSDQASFNLLINFPILKYYDRAYTFYQTIAYGEVGPANGQRPANGIYGVLDGACYGGDVCIGVHPDINDFPEFFGTNGLLDAGDVREVTANKVYDDLVLPAAKKALANDAGLKLQFVTPNNQDLSFTSDENGQVTGNKDEIIAGRLTNTIVDVRAEVAGDEDAQPVIENAGVLSQFFAQMKFIDPDPRFKVDKNKPNEFCWIADAKYVAS